MTFDLIAVHPADAGNASDWQTVNLTQRTVDLAAVQDVPQLLGNATLQAGTYTQLRIVVQSAQGVMTNGTQVNFTVPSGELMTADAFNVSVGQTTSLTVDIDLARSIVDAGNVWLFTPVLGSVQIGQADRDQVFVRPRPLRGRAPSPFSSAAGRATFSGGRPVPRRPAPVRLGAAPHRCRC